MADTLIEAAEVDIFVIEQLTKYHSGDVDFTLSAVAYHMQQCVEKSLKAVLESRGLDYRSMGHSIGKLYRSVLNHCEDIFTDDIIDFLKTFSSVLTQWEVSGRYPSDYIFSLDEIEIFYEKIKNIFNTCKDYINKDLDKVSSQVNKMNLNER